MTTLTKTCLAISAIGLTAGSIIDFGGHDVPPLLPVVLPVGAVFFGAFMISFMMEKEMVKFDAETAEKFESTNRIQPVAANCKNCGTCRCQPAVSLVPATAR
jgi:hypothetical protein